MDRNKGYYCVVQYCPDRARREVANIGVLLFCRGGLSVQVKLAGSNQRVTKFFGRGRSDEIDSLKNNFRRRIDASAKDIKTVEDLREFVDTRANEIVLTEPRFTRVTAAKETLEELYRELVEPSPKKKHPRFVDQIWNAFKTADVAEQVERHRPVWIPDLGLNETFPFAYQNGALNLIRAVRFVDLTNQDAIDKAGGCRSTSELLPEDKYRLKLVGEFKDTEQRAVVERVAKQRVTIIADTELDRLIEEIRSTAKPIADDSRT